MIPEKKTDGLPHPVVIHGMSFGLLSTGHVITVTNL